MKKAFFILFVASLVACSGDSSGSRGVLSQNKMAEVLMDYHVAERLATGGNISFDSAEVVFEKGLYPELLEKHQISKQDFERSFLYYSNNLKELSAVYDQVHEGLTLKDDSLKALRKK